MDTTEPIYQLVKQWCYALDQGKGKGSEALRQIAITTGCISDVPNQLTQKQEEYVVGWLQENYPNAYLWAIAKLSVGHPATIWGTYRTTVKCLASESNKHRSTFCLAGARNA